MIVRYWHPFQEVETLRHQLDNVFNEVSNAIETTSATWIPAFRLVENSDLYVLTVQLAGINPDVIDIQATRENIVITGERQQAEVAEGERLTTSTTVLSVGLLTCQKLFKMMPLKQILSMVF